jgi:gluconolactonase
MTAGPNPIDGFVVDASSISYVGDSLQRPECILAERDGSLWAADARGGVRANSTDWLPAIDIAERGE